MNKPFFRLKYSYGVIRGYRALDLFGKENPEVIILDLGLPDMDGEVVLTKIREINQDVPIAVLTGNTDPGMREKVLGLGATEYFQKPCRLTDLTNWAASFKE